MNELHVIGLFALIGFALWLMAVLKANRNTMTPEEQEWEWEEQARAVRN